MRWTIETLHRPAFELLDVVEFFFMPAMGDKMPDQTVKNWTVRGFLHPVMGKRGKKDVRRYSAADLFRIHLASRLVWQHTSLTAAFLAAECGVERIEALIRSGDFPSEPFQEHWITFRDNGENTSRYTGNDVTNFWVDRSYVIDGNVFSPPIPRIDWQSAIYEEKFEVFNLDKSIKSFFEEFCDVDNETNLWSKVVFMPEFVPADAETKFDAALREIELRIKEQDAEEATSQPNPDRPS